MKKIWFTLFVVLSGFFSFSQDLSYANKTIDTLCTPYFFGRGYVNNGQKKAADFIADEMKLLGIAPAKASGYFQEFQIPVNTFPGQMALTLNGNELINGVDYLVDPASKGGEVHITSIQTIDTLLLKSKKGLKKLLKQSKKKKTAWQIPVYHKKPEYLDDYIENYKGICLLESQNKLTWSVARYQKNYIHIQLKDEIPETNNCDYRLNIEARFVSNYACQNVIGLIEGQVKDTFVILGAHYDHLGGLGEKKYIAGANDNASGVAMLLDIANYFTKNKPHYSLLIMAFGAEEAGIVGSYVYVKNPVKPLNQTKFMFNMDLMGSGELGATVVNAKVYPYYFNQLNAINNANNYLKVIKKRGKAANSDHYFFSEAGIPSFFMYLMGDYNFYHELQDNCTQLDLGPHYEKTFLLIKDFIENLE